MTNRISHILHKMKWRADFLLHPDICLQKYADLDHVIHPPLKRQICQDARSSNIRERLRCLLRKNAEPLKMDFWLKKRICHDRECDPYFDVGDKKLFFLPPNRNVDTAQALDGALLIMKEAFIRKNEFFAGPVRIHPGDIVMDLGGNIGTSAIFFSKFVGKRGRVISFEPVYHDILEKNLVVNGVTNVETIPWAIGDVCHEVEFEVSDLGIDSRMANGSRTSKTEKFCMATLDAFVKDRRMSRVDFIKLDIEGAEELALRGAREVLRRFQPKLTVASYHTDFEGDPQHPKLVRLLKDWGYIVKEAGQKHIYAWHPENST